MSASVFSHLLYKKSHSGDEEEKSQQNDEKNKKKRTRTACKYIFICFVIFISFAVLCKLNPMTSLFCDLLL